MSEIRAGRVTRCPVCRVLELWCDHEDCPDPPADGRCNRCLAETEGGFFIAQRVPQWRGMMPESPYGFGLN